MLFGLFKRKPVAAKNKPVPQGTYVGEISHYFAHCKAGVLKLQTDLKVGDMIQLAGHTTDFKEKVTSMQIDGKAIQGASKGSEIGLLVKGRVRIGDKVYKIS